MPLNCIHKDNLLSNGTLINLSSRFPYCLEVCYQNKTREVFDGSYEELSSRFWDAVTDHSVRTVQYL